MKDVLLSVSPAAEGWWLHCDLPIEPTFYFSADVAEQTARALALRLTAIGRDVRVLVRDRLEQIVATHRYFSLA